jgi:hypothetical protein
MEAYQFLRDLAQPKETNFQQTSLNQKANESMAMSPRLNDSMIKRNPMPHPAKSSQ